MSLPAEYEARLKVLHKLLECLPDRGLAKACEELLSLSKENERDKEYGEKIKRLVGNNRERYSLHALEILGRKKLADAGLTFLLERLTSSR